MKGILVIGPAGSGTRIITEILVKNGCFGSFEHVQELDSLKPELLKGKETAVIRRSLPHNNWKDGRSSDLEKITNFFKDNGRKVIYVLTHRRPKYAANSQFVRHKDLAKNHEEGLMNIKTATRTLNNISGNVVPISYEMLVAYPKIMQRYLCSAVGLEMTNYLDIYDGNEKYK